MDWWPCDGFPWPPVCLVLWLLQLQLWRGWGAGDEVEDDGGREGGEDSGDERFVEGGGGGGVKQQKGGFREDGVA